MFYQRCCVVFHAFLVHLNADDRFIARNSIHNRHEKILHNGAQSSCAGFLFKGFPCYCHKRLGSKVKLNSVHREQRFILFGFGQNPYKSVFIKLLERCDNGESADELGNYAKLCNILLNDLCHRIFNRKGFLIFDVGFKTESRTADTFFDNLFYSVKCAAADEKNIRGVNLYALLLRMLSASLRRYIRNCSFNDFQQCLLNTLAADITGN